MNELEMSVQAPRVIIWWLVVLLAFFGVMTHWLKQVIMMRGAAVPGLNPIGFKKYWVTCWPESLVTLFSTAGVIAFFYEANMLTHATAYFIGYMGNSMADTVGGRVQAMINAPPGNKDGA